MAAATPRGPADSNSKPGQEDLGWLRRWGGPHPFGRSPPLQALPAAVPREAVAKLWRPTAYERLGREVGRALGAEWLEVPSAGHNDLLSHDIVWRRLADFLASTQDSTPPEGSSGL